MRHEQHLGARQNRVPVCLTKPLFYPKSSTRPVPALRADPILASSQVLFVAHFVASRHRKYYSRQCRVANELL
mgnify:CR=1 FL=1